MRKNGTIDLDDAWKNIQPFDDPPNVEEIKQSIGAYLKYDAFEIEIAMPSNFDYENTWDGDFSKKLRQAGAKDPLSRIRLGGSFPCYVQGLADDDMSGFVAECPTDRYNLSPVYLYLFTNGKEFLANDLNIP